jgi:hypothetical protein
MWKQLRDWLNLPIPPIEECLDLFLLFQIVEKVKNARVERLRVGDRICSRKCARRAQGEANLKLH